MRNNMNTAYGHKHTHTQYTIIDNSVFNTILNYIFMHYYTDMAEKHWAEKKSLIFPPFIWEHCHIPAQLIFVIV
jgi:hypothetical protein